MFLLRFYFVLPVIQAEDVDESWRWNNYYGTERARLVAQNASCWEFQFANVQPNLGDCRQDLELNPNCGIYMMFAYYEDMEPGLCGCCQEWKTGMPPDKWNMVGQYPWMQDDDKWMNVYELIGGPCEGGEYGSVIEVPCQEGYSSEGALTRMAKCMGQPGEWIPKCHKMCGVMPHGLGWTRKCNVGYGDKPMLSSCSEGTITYTSACKNRTFEFGRGGMALKRRNFEITSAAILFKPGEPIMDLMCGDVYTFVCGYHAGLLYRFDRENQRIRIVLDLSEHHNTPQMCSVAIWQGEPSRVWITAQIASCIQSIDEDGANIRVEAGICTQNIGYTSGYNRTNPHALTSAFGYLIFMHFHPSGRLYFTTIINNAIMSVFNRLLRMEVGNYPQYVGMDFSPGHFNITLYEMSSIFTFVDNTMYLSQTGKFQNPVLYSLDLVTGDAHLLNITNLIEGCEKIPAFPCIHTIAAYGAELYVAVSGRGVFHYRSSHSTKVSQYQESENGYGDPMRLDTCLGALQVIDLGYYFYESKTNINPTVSGVVLRSPIICPGGSYIGDLSTSWRCDFCPRGTYKPAYRNATETCSTCGQRFGVTRGMMDMTTPRPPTDSRRKGAMRPEQCMCLAKDKNDVPFGGDCTCLTGFYLDTDVAAWSDWKCRTCNVTETGRHRTTDPVETTRGATTAQACNKCLPGWYGPHDVSVTCSQCPVESTSEVGATEERECRCIRDTMYLDVATSTCLECPTNSEASGTECRCVADFVMLDTVNKICCESHSMIVRDGLCMCAEGMTYDNAMRTCVKCSRLNYKDVSVPADSENNACLRCNDYIKDSASLVDASTHKTQCICSRGSSNETAQTAVTCGNIRPSDGWCAERDSNAQWCRPCSKFVVSSIGSDGRGYPSNCPLSTANIARGYWRQDGLTRSIIRCINMDACLGGPNAATACADGHTGVLCNVCLKRWTLRKATCYPCIAGEVTVQKYAAVLGLILLLLGILYYIHSNNEERSRAVSSDTETIANPSDGTLPNWLLQGIMMLQRKFKIILSFYQVVTTIPRSYPVKFNLDFQHIMDYFGVVNLDITEIIPVDCFDLGGLSYYSRYILKVVTPVIISGLFYVAHSLFESSRRQATLQRVYIMFLFCIYPTMCTMGGESFRCVQTSDEGAPLKRFLEADYSIDCQKEAHKDFILVDVLCMILYPLGIPTYFLVVLWPHREALSQDRDQHLELLSGLEHLSSLCREYEPRTWWFEISECIRKYLLVSVCIAIFHGHPSSAMFTAILVCIFYLLFFQEISPYVYDIDDILCYVSLNILCLIFMLAAYTRFSNLLTDATSEDIVQEKEVFAFRELIILGAILVVFVFIFAFATSIAEVIAFLKNPDEDMVHYDFFGCGNCRRRTSGVEMFGDIAIADMPPLLRDEPSDEDDGELIVEYPVDAGTTRQLATMLTRRDQRIVELENDIGTRDMQIIQLENKLQTTQNELQNTQNELHNTRTYRRLLNQEVSNDNSADRSVRIMQMTQQRLTEYNAGGLTDVPTLRDNTQV